MSPQHRRPFLVDAHSEGPRLRIEAQSPQGAAREAWSRLEGEPPPLTVLDRETDDVTEWWVAVGSDRPTPLHRCDCGEPIRPTGRRGHPHQTCEGCREAVA